MERFRVRYSSSSSSSSSSGFSSGFFKTIFITPKRKKEERFVYLVFVGVTASLRRSSSFLSPRTEKRWVLEFDVEVFNVGPQPFLEGHSHYFWFDIVYEAFMVHELYAIFIELLAESSWEDHVDPLSSILFSLSRLLHPNRKKSLVSLNLCASCAERHNVGYALSQTGSEKTGEVSCLVLQLP